MIELNEYLQAGIGLLVFCTWLACLAFIVNEIGWHNDNINELVLFMALVMFSCIGSFFIAGGWVILGSIPFIIILIMDCYLLIRKVL